MESHMLHLKHYLKTGPIIHKPYYTRDAGHENRLRIPEIA